MNEVLWFFLKLGLSLGVWGALIWFVSMRLRARYKCNTASCASDA